MSQNNIYYKQVQLLLRVLPFINEQPCFALKGGTAINLFFRDFPRLSVDIDLVYLPDDNRKTALEKIKIALDNIEKDLISAIKDLKIIKSYQGKEDALRLIINQQGVSIKVELSPVLRGTVFEPTLKETLPSVEDEFGFAEVKVVALEDLYAGKLCAAFDRQHPRDFFDLMLLLEHEGITEGIRQAFLVYLISHARPMNELLTPNWKPIEHVFKSEFEGMTVRKCTVKELEQAAKTALNTLLHSFTEKEKQFLYSMYENSPKWDYLNFPHIQYLPAVKWKLLNIKKMSIPKRKQALENLKQALHT
ncbi:MAG: nucleotidyl transferase AbiEii/AbiGii toxin family protein [Alcaligenaceae bacterium]|nr:nucleotidyl transferase AbiEii/AbiGii toxin family protein [Alcaligenaceae bacterium]